MFLFGINVVDGAAKAPANMWVEPDFFFFCRKLVLTSHGKLYSAALTDPVEVARCRVYKSGANNAADPFGPRRQVAMCRRCRLVMTATLARLSAAL